MDVIRFVLESNRGSMEKICRVQKLGQIPYQAAWNYQNDLAAQVATGDHEETLLLLEHPHTFTIGRRGGAQHVLWSEEMLAEKDVAVIAVDRGGDITYHGPGQIVGYPILRLAPIGHQSDRLPQADYVGYIRNIEEVLIHTLAKFQIQGIRVKGKSGVWVESLTNHHPLKIASIGVKVDAKGISRHGFALNVEPDMAYWQGIIPCGLTGVEMTCMVDWNSEAIKMDQVMKAIETCFGKVFNMTMVTE